MIGFLVALVVAYVLVVAFKILQARHRAEKNRDA